jgi:hypothetical protein
MKPNGVIRGYVFAAVACLTLWGVALGAYWAGQEGGAVRAVAVFVAGTLALAAAVVFAVVAPVAYRTAPSGPQRDLATVVNRHVPRQVRR